jgi:hypothetical protein
MLRSAARISRSGTTLNPLKRAVRKGQAGGVFKTRSRFNQRALARTHINRRLKEMRVVAGRRSLSPPGLMYAACPFLTCTLRVSSKLLTTS